MDLNYLLERQQIERSRAQAAKGDAARRAHEELARKYEEQINELTGDEFSLPPNEHSPDEVSAPAGPSNYSVEQQH
jgi:hypothetical protein